MTSNREMQIADIINKREPFLRDIERKQEELSKRASTILALEQLHVKIVKSGISSRSERLKELHLPELWQKIIEEIKELDKPKSRFSRPTLNIGVIGRARQGKSRLLQSLSGLSSDVIPTGSAGHCTGVRSLICHDIGQQEHGEITFYKEAEFIENVIAPYYDELGLGEPPQSLVAFARQPLPPLPSTSPKLRKYVQSGEMYRHLKKYYDNIAEYRDLINANPLHISIQNVREYVAQESTDGSKKYFKYLAVKEAKIICNFGHSDVGQVALVDMPGLGDTGVGAAERLIAALGEHIDVVLFVLMPTPAAGILADVDFGLYDLAHQALPGISIDLWSYMVLNRTYPPTMSPVSSSNRVAENGHAKSPIFGDNYPNCQRIKSMIMSGSAGTEERRIHVVDSIITDCSDPTIAKDEILEPVLRYLVQSINELDTLYLSSWQKRLKDLQDEITRELEKASQAFEVSFGQTRDDQTFEELFARVWTDLTSSSDALLSRLNQESRTSSNAFTNYFSKTIAKCRTDTSLPTVDAIVSRRSNMNSYMSAFNAFLDEMRTHLTYHFADMDNNLKLTMDGVKMSVAEIFLDKGHLLDLLGKGSREDFFSLMATQRTLSPRLQETFQAFAKYELSLRGFFQSRIRQCLGKMIPDRANERIDILNANEVLNKLKEIHSETVKEIYDTLKHYESEPNDATLAIVDEFVDQIFRSQNAKDAWRAFYRTNKGDIWVSEFEHSATLEAFQREWQISTKRAIEVNNSNRLASFQAFTTNGRVH